MNAIKSHFLEVTDARVDAHIYHCSDGTSFRNFKKAYKHEMHLRIFGFFPESAVCWSKRFGGRGYYIDRHNFLKCGVYRVTLTSPEDADILNFFFRGLRDELPELGEGDYPYDFNLDIYYEEHAGTLLPKAQWRLYDEENYR